MSTVVADPAKLAARPAAVAVAALFGLNGLQVGVFGGSLPSLRDRLGVGAGGVSLMLLTFAAFAVLSMQVGGRLADRIGARTVALVTLPTLIVAIGLLSFAPSLPWALAALVLAGLGNGAIDVAMNALGVQVEAARPKPIMSFFHACWSIGNLAGAATVFGMSQLLGRTGGGAAGPALLTAALIGAVGFALIVRIVPVGRTIAHVDDDGAKVKLPALAWLLGAMGFSFGLAEGTAVDWSSIHVTDIAEVDPSTGALGLVAVSGFMVIIRLFGDRAVSRFGRRAVVRFGGTTAFAGYVVTLLGDSLPLLLTGWALVGLGMGMVAPQVYAVAGHTGGGRMLAVVVTFGYAAFLVGPALIGGLVSWIGVQYAMVLPMILAAGLIAIAGVLPREAAD